MLKRENTKSVTATVDHEAVIGFLREVFPHMVDVSGVTGVKMSCLRRRKDGHHISAVKFTLETPCDG